MDAEPPLEPGSVVHRRKGWPDRWQEVIEQDMFIFSENRHPIQKVSGSIKSRTADSSAVAEQIPTTSKANTNNADVELVCPL